MPSEVVLFAILLCLGLPATAGACYVWVGSSARGRLYSDVKTIPPMPTALVLGTRRTLRDGRSNPYFEHRMDAAACLYREGKVTHLLLSGDSCSPGRTETRDMKQALVTRGVPENAMTLDPLGIRTLDSVVRSREVFSQNDVTIVSQAFHNRRALFIARYHGISAVGFTARAVPVVLHLKTFLRECLARVRVVLDLYVLKTRPGFPTGKDKDPSNRGADPE